MARPDFASQTIAMDDHYEALGLEQTATPEEIKKAFKQLALKYHPDQHPSPIANAIFRTLNEAYLVLSDPEKRRAYDEELRRRRRAPRGRPAPDPQPPRPDRPADEPDASRPRRSRERERREAVQRKDLAKERARQVRGVSEQSVRESDESMRDLYAAAEAEVQAEERRERRRKR
jgi:curved DNA-binding protein CbpA